MARYNRGTLYCSKRREAANSVGPEPYLRALLDEVLPIEFSFLLAPMSFGRPPGITSILVTPPDRGSFPLDHDGASYPPFSLFLHKSSMKSYLPRRMQKLDDGLPKVSQIQQISKWCMSSSKQRLPRVSNAEVRNPPCSFFHSYAASSRS